MTPSEEDHIGEAEDGIPITFTLQFAAAPCPECGEMAVAGPCPKCGATVPPPGESRPPELARRAAFTAARARLRELVQQSEQLPVPHIRIAADQYARALNDANIAGLVVEVLAFAHRLDTLGLNDPSTIGGSARRAIIELVTMTEGVLDATIELARFRPPDEIAELRELMLRLGQRGVALAMAILEVLVAQSPQETNVATSHLNAMLSDPTAGVDTDELFARVIELAEPNLDARVTVALGLPGHFGDQYGLPDPSRVFYAASRVGNPFEVLARGAACFFRHLLQQDPEKVPLHAAILAEPAMGLALVDRPLPAHRIALDTIELLRRAYAMDPEGTRALIESMRAQGDRIFAAAHRIRRDLRLLATGDIEG